MTKIVRIAVCAALLPFLMAACDNDPAVDDDGGENPFKGSSLAVIGQQVWTRNRYASKISQAYLPYTEDHELYAVVYTDIPAAPFRKLVPLTGTHASGIISGGVMRFAVQDMPEDSLLLWDSAECTNPSPGACDYDACDYLKCFDRGCAYHQCEYHTWFTLRSFFREWKDLAVDPPASGRIGNVAVLVAVSTGDSGQVSAGVLDRQGISGTRTTISCETILYVYVKDNCRITGTADTGFLPGNYYYSTDGDLDIALKKGWNLLSRKETYGTDFSGSAVIAMEIKNPIKNPEQYRWTITLGFGL